jgi:hypothetical protein
LRQGNTTETSGPSVITYDRWMFCNNADNPIRADFLRTYVSNDDGATWTFVHQTGGTVGDRSRAQLAEEIMVVLTSRPEDIRTPSLGQLDRDGPDPTGSRVDEDGLSRPDIQRAQRRMRSLAGRGERSGHIPRHVHWLDHHGVRIHQRVFGMGRSAGPADNFVANGNAGDPLA